MRLAVQDIRVLGYKKICKEYLWGTKKESFLDYLRDISTLYCTMKIPAYSWLNKCDIIHDRLGQKDKNIKGYDELLFSFELSIDFSNPSESAKRKCRKTWDKIWDNFGVCAGFEGYQVELLKDFGIKVLFIYLNQDSDNPDLNELCGNTRLEGSDLKASFNNLLKFYNSVIMWAMFCMQEANFTKNNMSYLDVLNMLAVIDSKDFYSKLLELY